eukprot:TRINITY_DN4268_c0_g4_i2.p1 TRINITY_DN4268_c0_g4~~TRINITY_DN4268_c0_g4_i2.p1  ORF type:complete len:480 (+),score=96.46 TRINITY_DN4268_c0_g4_i2:59-1498(+)
MAPVEGAAMAPGKGAATAPGKRTGKKGAVRKLPAAAAAYAEAHVTVADCVEFIRLMQPPQHLPQPPVRAPLSGPRVFDPVAIYPEAMQLQRKLAWRDLSLSAALVVRLFDAACTDGKGYLHLGTLWQAVHGPARGTWRLLVRLVLHKQSIRPHRAGTPLFPQPPRRGPCGPSSPQTPVSPPDSPDQSPTPAGPSALLLTAADRKLLQERCDMLERWEDVRPELPVSFRLRSAPKAPPPLPRAPPPAAAPAEALQPRPAARPQTGGPARQSAPRRVVFLGAERPRTAPSAAALARTAPPQPPPPRGPIALRYSGAAAGAECSPRSQGSPSGSGSGADSPPHMPSPSAGAALRQLCRPPRRGLKPRSAAGRTATPLLCEVVLPIAPRPPRHSQGHCRTLFRTTFAPGDVWDLRAQLAKWQERADQGGRRRPVQRRILPPGSLWTPRLSPRARPADSTPLSPSPRAQPHAPALPYPPLGGSA